MSTNPRSCLYLFLTDKLTVLKTAGTIKKIARWNNQISKEKTSGASITPAVLIQIENKFDSPTASNYDLQKGDVIITCHIDIDVKKHLGEQDWDIFQAVYTTLAGELPTAGTDFDFTPLERIDEIEDNNYDGRYHGKVIFKTFLQDCTKPATRTTITGNIDGLGLTVNSYELPEASVPVNISPSGIKYDMDFFTGQTEIYEPGDDGWHARNGTYIYNGPIFPIRYAKLDLSADDPWTTLEGANAFGNTNRFTALDGSQNFTSTRIIDHLSGWEFDILSRSPAGGGWAGNIQAVHQVEINGHDDWMVLNRKQILYIHKANSSYNYEPLISIPGTPLVNTRVMTSTTNYSGSFVQTFIGNTLQQNVKSADVNYMIGRKYYD